MTRVIGGEFGGRKLAVPAGGRVRPTADRVREAWMSILQSHLRGARVLDLFAGSGALGLEALSRGAFQATFVDIEPAALAVIHSNIAALGVTAKATVRRLDAMRFVEKLDRVAFDVCFADPPFTLPLAEQLIAAYRERPFAKILSVEHGSDVTPALADETRRYGDVSVSFCHLT